MRPKDIGTRFETAVVTYLRSNGFGQAERRALHGVDDRGDITGTPGVAWECKAGAVAHGASDMLIERWLDDTERERIAAGADVALLVVARRGVGTLRVGNVWAVVRAAGMPPGFTHDAMRAAGPAPLRMHLSAAVIALRRLGYGDPVACDADGVALDRQPRRTLHGDHDTGVTDLSTAIHLGSVEPYTR